MRWKVSGSLQAFFLFATLSIAGCGSNLADVRGFATLSAASADYQLVLADYTNSPENRKRFSPSSDLPKLEAEKAARAKQKDGMVALQSVLVEYMKALGDLAADALPNVDDDIDSLTTALEGSGVVGDGSHQIKKETVSAAAVIAKSLTNAILDSWRQSRLKDIVVANDEHVQALVGGLLDLLSDLKVSVENEKENVRKPFEAWMAATKDAAEKHSDAAVKSANKTDAEKASVDASKAAASAATTSMPIAGILLEDHYEEVLVRLNRIEKYGEVLKKIGEGHKALAENIGKLDEKSINAKMKAYSAQLQKLYKAVKQLGR